MGRYTIEISKEALVDLSKIKKSGKKADLSKVQKIFLELEIHPTIGIGKPKKLKYKSENVWFRQINKKEQFKTALFYFSSMVHLLTNTIF